MTPTELGLEIIEVVKLATKPLEDEIERLTKERNRYKAGLEIIQEAAPIHGGVWAKIQARGHLLDLDFDMWPETGRPETEPDAT